jgi:ribosomal protein S12 methylthiotransferase
MKKTNPDKIGIVNLGCVRNTVDAENILGRLLDKGHPLVSPEDADVVIVNTCSFIEDAKKESVDAILEMVELKKQGRIKKIIVAGCLPERYGGGLVKEIPEIDAFVGAQSLDPERLQGPGSLTPFHYAYLKICESCFNQCSFCIIPRIKGRFVSRTIPSLLSDVRSFAARGVKELNIIGQDITAYGLDIYREKKLPRLLLRLARHAGPIEWIRLLYAYPAHVTDELINVVADEPKICKYIDIPFQHVNDRILKAMNRPFTYARTVRLIEKMRRRIPGVSLRTTFLVGFPGETDREFRDLQRFLRDNPMERVGVFTYSREEGTRAYDLRPLVPLKVRLERQKALMEAQKKISAGLLKQKIGSVVKVLVDSRQKDTRDVYIGRTEQDAPDVDGRVYVQSPVRLSQGDFVRVRITGAMDHDLQGEAL